MNDPASNLSGALEMERDDLMGNDKGRTQSNMAALYEQHWTLYADMSAHHDQGHMHGMQAMAISSGRADMQTTLHSKLV